MDIKILGMLAETPIHVGIGQANDVIDLPVAREATTSFPHIPGSGMKGAFKVWAEHVAKIDEADRNMLFGKSAAEDKGGDKGDSEGAGTLLIGEARLALLPVRSTLDSYKLVTCPLIVNRLNRDRKRTGLKEISASVAPEDQGCIANKEQTMGLEEREFKAKTDEHGQYVELFKPLTGALGEDALKQKLVVLTDKDFAWFARFSLPTAMRNKLDDNKTVENGALWSEEALPADSILWTVLSERKADSVKTLADKMKENPYIQIGGNETIGQGWFHLHELKNGEG